MLDAILTRDTAKRFMTERIGLCVGRCVIRCGDHITMGNISDNSFKCGERSAHQWQNTL